MAKACSLSVIYQSDENYVPVSAISILSLLDNNSHLSSIDIYYCGYKLSEVSKKRLSDIVGRFANASLKFMPTDDYHNKFVDLKVRPWHGVYVTWIKLFAVADIPDNRDRVLYINPHTIINGSLEQLANIDLGNNVMALSYDALTNEHKKTIGLKPSDGYYNCGVMLINRRLWKSENLDDYLKDQLSIKSDYVIADQDLCNVLFRHRILTLPVAYNFSSAYYAYGPKEIAEVNDLKPPYFYSYEQIMESYYSPIVIHSLFGVLGKPWEKENLHPNRHLWAKYMNQIPWVYDEVSTAKKTLNWRLYRILPRFMFLQLYIIAVKRKFARQ